VEFVVGFDAAHKPEDYPSAREGSPSFPQIQATGVVEEARIGGWEKLVRYEPRDSPLKIVAAALPDEIEEFSVEINKCWPRLAIAQLSDAIARITKFTFGVSRVPLT
jgi:hypothetical protein